MGLVAVVEVSFAPAAVSLLTAVADMRGALQGLADLLLVIPTIPVAQVTKPAGDGASLPRTHILFPAGEFLFTGISTLVE